MTVLRACCPPAPARVLGQAARLLTLTRMNHRGSQMAAAGGGQTLRHRGMRGLVRNSETLCHSWPLHWGRTAWLRGPLAEATRAALPPVTAPRWHPAPAEARRGGLGQRRGGAGWASGGEGQGGPAAGTTELLDDSVPVLEGRRCPETRDPTGGPQASATAREAGPKRTSAQGPTPHG